MSARHTVLVIDREPREIRAMLRQEEAQPLPFNVLVLKFSVCLPVLVKDTMGVKPDLVVLGSGFGNAPFIGERFVDELKQAGFKGKVAVLCHDTFKVLPQASVVRLKHEDGKIRQALLELMSEAS
jgi:hypothetical protein